VNFFIAGRPEPAADALPLADFAHASPNYFDVIGLKMRAGRGFTEADRAAQEKDAGGVAIVNGTFARKFFEGEEPLGKRLLSPDKKQAFEIIGVASDYRPMGAENGSRPQIFYPYLELRSATVVVNSAVKPLSLTQALQSAVWSLDKDIPIEKIRPMDLYVDEWQAQRRFNTLLLALFAALALALALMGIYGVLSNLVTSRVREIGIRMALGARPGMIGALVLRQSMIPVAIGALLGLAGSLALSRFLEALLFDVKPRDPLTLALATLGILAAAPLAIAVPLRRATRVECTEALREE
jgi:predicted permease